MLDMNSEIGLCKKKIILASAASQEEFFFPALQAVPKHKRAKEPIFSTVEYFSLPFTDQTCMAYVKQIIFFSAQKSANNIPAACSQVAGRNSWILPHRLLQELSAPIQAYVKAEED